MRAEMRAILKHLLSFFCFVFVQAESSDLKIRLENYCDKTVYLACPDSSSSRAGKLYFYIVPRENCFVNVQTVSNCNINHAIYFNIPRSDLDSDDFVKVYENIHYGSNGTTGDLIKRIPGGSSPHNRSPPSVAQLLTSYSKQHRLRIDLHLEPKTDTNYGLEVHFDYTIARQTSRAGEGYCGTLNGFLPNEICDGTDTSRVNCPAAYTPGVGITNRATGHQACTLRQDRAAGTTPTSALLAHTTPLASTAYYAQMTTTSPQAETSTPFPLGITDVDVTPPSPQGGQLDGGGQERNETRFPLHQTMIPATVPVTQSTVTYRLQWQDAPDNGGAISRYNIIYYQRDHSDQKRNASSAADFVDLKDLEPGEIYQAYVHAENEYGSSQPLSVTFKTQSVVTSADTSQNCQTEIVDHTATSLLLAFSLQDGNDKEVNGFDVQFSRADEPFEHPVSVAFERGDRFLVKGLQPATRYRFRITARSSGRDSGKPCGEFETITPDVGPPLAPKPALGNTVSFDLHWETPDNGSVQHYKLDYWTDPRFGEKIHHNYAIAEAPKTSYTLSSLEPCRKHQVEISPRGKPKVRGNRSGVHAKKRRQLPRTAQVIKVTFTTDCTIVTGSVDNPGFSL